MGSRLHDWFGATAFRCNVRVFLDEAFGGLKRGGAPCVEQGVRSLSSLFY